MIRPTSEEPSAKFCRYEDPDTITLYAKTLLENNRGEDALKAIGKTQLGLGYNVLIATVVNIKAWEIGVRILQKIENRTSKLEFFINLGMHALDEGKDMIVSSLHALLPRDQDYFFAECMASYSLKLGNMNDAIKWLFLIESKEKRVFWIVDQTAKTVLSNEDLSHILRRYMFRLIEKTEFGEIVALLDRLPCKDDDLLLALFEECIHLKKPNMARHILTRILDEKIKRQLCLKLSLIETDAAEPA